MKTKQTPIQFFHEHAGYSVGPNETEEEGRMRCAVALANAERAGNEAGLCFRWDIDPDTDSSDFCDDPEPWALWYCECLDEEGDLLASLSGIDFGRGGEPWGDPYRRVVEAELAQEALKR